MDNVHSFLGMPAWSASARRMGSVAQIRIFASKHAKCKLVIEEGR